MTQLVVMSEATAERLGKDARLGRAVRLVALPMVAGVGAVFGFAALVGSTPAILVALAGTAVFLAWESVGPAAGGAGP